MIAHVGCAVILLHVFAASVNDLANPLLLDNVPLPHLWLGLVFVEATVFYPLAAWLRRHGANIYAATAAACFAVWQLAAHLQVPDAWYTMLYAGLGLALLILREPSGWNAPRFITPRDIPSGNNCWAGESPPSIRLRIVIRRVCRGPSARARVAGDQFARGGDRLAFAWVDRRGGCIAAVIAPAGGWRRAFSASAAALVDCSCSRWRFSWNCRVCANCRSWR